MKITRQSQEEVHLIGVEDIANFHIVLFLSADILIKMSASYRINNFRLCIN